MSKQVMKRIGTGHYEGTVNGKTISVVSLACHGSTERGWIYGVDGEGIDVKETKSEAVAAAVIAAS